VSSQVVLEELFVVAVVTPQVLIAAHRERVTIAGGPFVEEDPVFVEDLNPPIETVGHIDAAVIANCDPVWHGELAVVLAGRH
jgi:hypothetical protein